MAQRNSERQVGFFAVGFETAAPATALATALAAMLAAMQAVMLAAMQAQQLQLENFSLLVSHVCVLPAMEALMQSPGHPVTPRASRTKRV